MEGLLIALLIAAVSSIFNNRNKANQRKRPMNTKPAKKREDNNSYSSQKNDAKPKPKPNANYGISYVSTEPVTEKIQHSNIIYEEADNEDEETLDIGLSDMQKAIVMAEILDKPLALRKK